MRVGLTYIDVTVKPGTELPTKLVCELQKPWCTNPYLRFLRRCQQRERIHLTLEPLHCREGLFGAQYLDRLGHWLEVQQEACDHARILLRLQRRGGKEVARAEVNANQFWREAAEGNTGGFIDFVPSSSKCRRAQIMYELELDDFDLEYLGRQKNTPLLSEPLLSEPQPPKKGQRVSVRKDCVLGGRPPIEPLRLGCLLDTQVYLRLNTEVKIALIEKSLATLMSAKAKGWWGVADEREAAALDKELVGLISLV